jgi:hypothetical protein
MVVFRDEKRIARLARLAQVLSLGGLAALVIGLLFIFISDNPNVFLYQLAALIVGYGLSQIGLHLAHRYLRQPRMDQVLDRAVLKAGRKDGRMYHYLQPAPHVLLLPNGIFLLVAKFQTGRIIADGDSWKQTGLGMRRFFGREGLGNPTREAEAQVANMAAYLKDAAPSVTNPPITPIIVFTAQNIENLDVKDSRIPAVHHSKLSSLIRQYKDKQKALPRVDFDALQTALDAKATHLIEATVEEGSE